MTETTLQILETAGAHFGYSRTRRHPSATPFLFGTKDRTDFFDLSQTAERLEAAKEFVKTLSGSGKQILFVGGKNESAQALKDAALRAGAPYVAGRWIGGTLTNFKNIHKRIDRLQNLIADSESGVLEQKYTKREQLMISREIERLTFRFGGIVSMRELPGALFVIDPRHEQTAVREANQLKIPIVALASSDCDFSQIRYPIPGNDTAHKSIHFIIEQIAEACMAGRRAPAAGAHAKPPEEMKA